MAATNRRVTYAEIVDWPDDGQRYELYDGEVVVVPAPILRHQRVALHVIELLHDYEEHVGGAVVPAPFDIVFSDYNVVQPDVVYFKPERRHLLDDWGPAHVPPDLAVEVLSAGTQARDRGGKMALLARFAVPEYWIIDPAEKTLEVYVLRGAAYELAVSARRDATVRSPTLGALSFVVSRVFAG